MWILKCPVSPEDAAYLIVALTANGDPDSMTAAQEIKRGIDFGLHEVGLVSEERDAVLACLDDPDGLLELRDEIVKRREEAEYRAANAYWEVLDENFNFLYSVRGPRPAEEPMPPEILRCEECNRDLPDAELEVREIERHGQLHVYGRYCTHCGSQIDVFHQGIWWSPY